MDKEIVLEKVVEVPVINKIYKQVPQEKIVDVYKEVVVERVVEVPEEEIVPVDIDLNTVVGKVVVNEQIQQMPLETKIRKAHLNPQQVTDFEASSRRLADVTAENEAIKAQISALQQRLSIMPKDRVDQAQAQQMQLQNEIQNLRHILAQETAERQKLRAQNSQPQEVELVENVDMGPSEQLKRDIELVRAKNDGIRNFLQTTRDVARQNAQAKAEAHAPTVVQTTTEVVSAPTQVFTQVAPAVQTQVITQAAPVTRVSVSPGRIVTSATRVSASPARIISGGVTRVAQVSPGRVISGGVTRVAQVSPGRVVSTGVVSGGYFSGGVTRISQAPVASVTRVSNVHATSVTQVSPSRIIATGGYQRIGGATTRVTSGPMVSSAVIGAPVSRNTVTRYSTARGSTTRVSNRGSTTIVRR